MANMFSGNVDKTIPKDLKDCYKTDSITQNLWSWCERLERWGYILCVIMVFVGIIAIISNAVETAQLLDEYNIDTYEIRELMAEEGIKVKSVFEVVVEDIIKWSLYCFLEYCAYHILALLIGSLATIVQHTKISANIALYNSAKAESISDDYEEESIKKSVFSDTDNYESEAQKDNAPSETVKLFYAISAIVVIALILIIWSATAS